MLQAIWFWFNHPLVQSVLISPLVGAIFGVILAGLNSPSSTTSAISVQQTIVIQNRTTIVQHGHRNSSTGDDGFAFIIGAIFIIVVVVGGYSAYSNEILQIVLEIVLGCLSFVLSSALVSVLMKHYQSDEWLVQILCPLFSLLFCLRLVYLAHYGLIPGAREYAQANGFLPFYFRILTLEQRHWITFQVVGVILLSLLALVSSCGSLHYLALMNARGSNRLTAIWTFVIQVTNFASGWRGTVLCVMLAALSFITLSGIAYSWIV